MRHGQALDSRRPAAPARFARLDGVQRLAIIATAPLVRRRVAERDERQQTYSGGIGHVRSNGLEAEARLFSFTAASWMDLGGRRCTRACARRATPSALSRIRRLHLLTTSRVTKRVIAAQSLPVILVGHSYGGAVITEAGNDPKVEALVYIAAFAPDKGESVRSLIKNPPPGAPVPPILAPQDGFLPAGQGAIRGGVRGRRATERAEFMADSQVPWGVEALAGAVSQPAWKAKPSWYMVATDDRMISTARTAAHGQARRLQRWAEVAGSHAVYVSQPGAVVQTESRKRRRRQGFGSIRLIGTRTCR